MARVAGADATRLLMRHNAKARTTADGETPSTLAAKRGARNVMRILSGTDDHAVLKSAITREFAPLDPPLFAQAIARERGIPAGGEIALAQETADFERVFEHSGLVGASSTGYSVMAMTARRLPADGKTDATVNHLIGHREADGRWASRSNRQPLPAGDHHATAFGIFVLRSYGRPARRMEIDAHIGRAVAWLREHAPVSSQDAAMPVLGISPPPGSEYGGAGKVVGRNCPR